MGKAKSGLVGLIATAGQAWIQLTAALIAAVVAMTGWPNPAAAQTSMVVANPPANNAQGSVAILPGGGFNVTSTNFKPYAVPGQEEDAHLWACFPQPNNAPFYFQGDPFVVSYANPGKQPVQSSDWWTSLGLQLDTWVGARGGTRLPPNQCVPPTNAVANTAVFYSEPFQLQFVDFADLFPKDFPPPAGVQLWNMNNFEVAANTKLFDFSKMPPEFLGYNSNLDSVSWGVGSPTNQSRVTIGLEGVHPLRVDEFPTGGPITPPWTNILVQSYSDWGVVASVHDKSNSNQLTMTAANGSPFVWFERTAGSAAFEVWLGGTAQLGDGQGNFTMIDNSGQVMIVRVQSFFAGQYNPPGMTPIAAQSYYAIAADQGTWEKVAGFNGQSAVFKNPAATSVIVAALPHNTKTPPALGQIGPMMAWKTLEPYACLKTVDTKLLLPTPATSVTVGGQSVTLGYDPSNATVTGELQITTQMVQGFAGQCSQTKPFQLVFPHHRQALIKAQQSQVFTQQPMLLWNSMMGPVMGYVGDTMFLQNSTRGIMPMLPSVAIDDPQVTNPNNPNQTAAEDIYDTLKTWYFIQEPTTNNQQVGSFTRQPGSYMGVGNNTYLNASTTPRELLVVADQLAQTSNPKIKGVLDPQLGETKDQAALEMRDFILHSLEEQVGQWFDVFTANLLEYNTEFNTVVGYPTGFLAVQHLNDHHLHYGYFLRAAAAIGRYDPVWLAIYGPIVREMLLDVAAFDNGASGFPQLRNFNPYYGHSWADGSAYGGTNQESNSEAINFEMGMVELGEEMAIPQWRDLGLYLYEQEILAAEQYYFNQDADLTDTATDPDAKCPDKAPYTMIKSTPPICYNGNWPRDFVTYKSGVDKQIQHHTFISRLQNQDIDRTTFFDDSPIAAYTIQWIPAAPALAYLARSLLWLQATWNQFIADDALYQSQSKLNPSGLNVYQDVAASVQGMLPASGSGMTGTGLAAALARINNPHPFFFAAMNTEAKYLAYTYSVLGQLDASVAVTSPEAGAFKSGGTTSFVAYNPTASPISVTFTGASGGGGPFSVAPFTLQSFVGGSSTSNFKPGGVLAPPNRLYFRNDTACTPASPCSLTQAPGTTLLPATGTYPFPTGPDLISTTMAVIPPRSDGKNQQFPAPLDGILSWVGQFSGSLIGAPASSCGKIDPNGPTVCDPTQGLQSVDRFELYANDCLNPGFQNCTPSQSAGNTYNMQVLYFFDTKNLCDPIKGDPNGKPCNADRVELYTLTTGAVNTWTLQNKSNEYYFSGVNLGYPGQVKTSGFNGSFGLNLGLSAASCTGQPENGIRFAVIDTFTASLPGTCTNTAGLPPAGMFWQSVTNGAVQINLWGGAFAPNTKEPPTPISVEVAPASNRASWFQPPYQ
jgi:hypothetical protein